MDRSLTRISDASEAVGRGRPISRPSSPSRWSTMCTSLRPYRPSTVASRFSRGPTIKARVIGTGLGIQGTFELLNQPVNRSFQIRVGFGLEGVRLAPPCGEDLLRFAGDRGLRLVNDFRMTPFGLAPQLVSQLERLATGVPEDPLAFRQDGLLHPADLALGRLDFLESFLFPHVRTSGDN